MLVLTEAAAEVVKSVTSTPQTPDGMGLRIVSSAREPEDPGALQLAAAAGPGENDQVIEAAGARVFLEPQAAAYLDDKVLDAQLDEQGKAHFTLDMQDADQILRVKVQVAPRHRDKFPVTGHPIRQPVLGLQARGKSPKVLYVINAQQLNDPARWRAERADDNRAAAGRKACSDRQRPYSGAVQERHPGQVQDKPLDPVIEDPGRMLQELAGRAKV